MDKKKLGIIIAAVAATIILIIIVVKVIGKNDNQVNDQASSSVNTVSGASVSEASVSANVEAPSDDNNMDESATADVILIDDTEYIEAEDGTVYTVTPTTLEGETPIIGIESPSASETTGSTDASTGTDTIASPETPVITGTTENSSDESYYETERIPLN